MKPITVNGVTPQVDPTAWVAENAVLTGDIVVGEHSSIWYGVVIRGDVNKIRIGNNSNIQDLTMVHGSNGGQDTIIGNNVSIGHRAIIHGCTIEDHVLIGMGAIVLDNVTVPSNTIIAAGAVVTSGTILEKGYIYAGIPARKMKVLDENKANRYIAGTSAAYIKNKELYR